jgi:hypothetical protein
MDRFFSLNFDVGDFHLKLSRISDFQLHCPTAKFTLLKPKEPG